MDISKYIGLFLLKNRFCYIHGLGNLELKKKPATFDGSVLKLSPYEVQITPAGSIDDNLANFIATNEQTSISKAANYLKDFSIKSRTELAAGKEVIIPFVGKFVEINGKITFITDPDLQYTPPGIPAIKHARRKEDEIADQTFSRKQDASQKPVTPVVKPPESDAKISDKLEDEILYDEPDRDVTGTINWKRIVVFSLILVVMIASIIFGIKMVIRHPKTVRPINIGVVADSPLNPAVAHLSKSVSETSLTAVKSTDSTSIYNMVIGTYLKLKDAQKREKQLQNYGHDVHVVTKDSLKFFVVIPMKCKTTDTTHLKDSLKLFEPKGVSIFR